MPWLGSCVRYSTSFRTRSGSRFSNMPWSGSLLLMTSRRLEMPARRNLCALCEMLAKYKTAVETRERKASVSTGGNIRLTCLTDRSYNPNAAVGLLRMTFLLSDPSSTRKSANRTAMAQIIPTTVSPSLTRWEWRKADSACISVWQ